MGQEPDPAARARRRTFTAEYKLAILEEYEQLPVGSPERGALLRREGLYSSHIAEWRKQRDAAALEGLSPKARRPKKTAEQAELERLRRRNAQNPARFGYRRPSPPKLPTVAWINEPSREALVKNA